MSGISKEILEKIKDDKITPRPKWEFLMKDYVIWSLFVVVLILGGFASSVIIFVLTDQDWDIYKYMHKSFGEYFLLSVPYFWFILVALFLVFAWMNIRKTRTGYKYDFIKIGILNVLASLILGGIFFFLGIGNRIEGVFANNIPLYRQMHPFNNANAKDFWNRPEEGLLFGEVTTLNNNGNFIIRDFKDNSVWTIDCSSCLWIIKQENIKTGSTVKLIGKRMDGNNFQGFEVRKGNLRGPRNDFPMPPPQMFIQVEGSQIN